MVRAIEALKRIRDATGGNGLPFANKWARGVAEECLLMLDETTTRLATPVDPLTSKERVLRLLDEFCEIYERVWTPIVGENRTKATVWDIHQLRYKIEKELSDEGHSDST